MASKAELALILSLVDEVTKTAKSIKGELGDIGKGAQGLQGQLTSVGKTIATGMMAGVAVAAGAAAAAIGASVKSAAEWETTVSKLDAVQKSMGQSSGFTTQQLLDQASALQMVTRHSDDAIVAGQSILATFSQVGGEIFQRATEVGLDLAEVFGTSIPGAATMLGKALNDPIQGISALTRVGVSFTDAEKDMIKALQESGDMVGAQGIIMEALEMQVGGAARAVGETFTGRLAQARNALDDVGKTIGAAVLPAVTELASKFVEWLSSEAVQVRIQEIADGLADMAQKALGLVSVIGDVVRWFRDLDPAAVKVAAGMTAIGLGIPVAVAGVVALKGAVIALTAAIAANPIGLIAVGIVAAGLGIAAVIDKINKQNAEFAEQQRVASDEAVRASATYAEYEAAMAKLIAPMKDFAVWQEHTGGTLAEWPPAMEAVRSGLVLTAEAFEQAKAAVQSYSMTSQAELDELVHGFAENEAAIARYGANVTAEMQRAAAQMQAHIGEFMTGFAKIHTDGLTQIEQLHADHGEKLAAIQASYAQQQEDAEFAHQLKRLQAQAQYEADALDLVRMGKEDELGELAAKFQAAEANADAAYSQQQAMAELNYLQQQMIQQQAYMDELDSQHRKTMLALAMQAMEYEQKLGIAGEGENLLLQVILAGADDQLATQIAHASNMMKVSAELSEGQIDNAIKTVEAIKAAYADNVDAARATMSGLKRDFSGMKNAILAGVSRPYTPSDFGFTPASKADISRAAADTGKAAGTTAKDNAVKTMADVAKAIEGGVASAKKAIEGLVDFEIPAGVDAGLQKYAEFVTMAVKRIYEAFDDPVADIKTKIAEMADYIKPLGDLLRLIGTPIELKIAEEEPPWEIWGQWLFRSIMRVIDVLQTVRGAISDEGLEAATGISEYIQKITSLFSVGGMDAMRALTEGEMPDLETWGVRLAAMFIRGIDVLQFLRGYITDKGLEAAVGISDDLGKVATLFSVGGVAAMLEIVGLKFPDLELWGRRLAAMMVRGIEVLQFLRGYISNEGLAAAASISEHIRAIAQLFEVKGIKAMQELVDLKWPDLGMWGQRLAAIIMRGIEVLQWVRGQIADDALKAAAGIAEDLGKVLSVLSIKTEVGNVGKRFGDQVVEHLAALELAAPLIRAALARVGAQWDSVEALAADVDLAEKLRSFFSILDLNKLFQELQTIQGLKEGERRTALSNVIVNLVTMLEAGAPMLKDALQNLKSVWGSVEALAEDADLAETIKRLFSILDISKVLEEMRLEKPLEQGQRKLPLVTVIGNFIDQIKAVVPMLRDGLAELDTLFDDALLQSIGIVDNVATVFEALGRALQMGAGMSGTTGWSLGSVLRLINELATASAAVSAIPQPAFGAPVVPPATGADGGAGAGSMDPAVIRQAIIDGIQGSGLDIELSLVQDPSQRAEFTARLGRLETLFTEFVTRWEAASA